MKKYILLIIFFLALFILSAGASYFWGLYKNVYVESQPSEEPINPESSTPTPTPTPDPLGPKNILLLGYGGAGHVDGSLLTDTIILAHLVPREKRVVLISIPRDILVPLPTREGRTQLFKLNHAYAIGTDDRNYPDKPSRYKGAAGGGNMAKDAATTITQLKVDNFVAADFVGFINIVDTLGEVNVYVPYTFTDNFYPLNGEENNPCEKSDDEIKLLTATMSGELLEQQFPCRYETLHFDKGAQTINGETALKFVRSRHSEVGGSDFGRALRQQAFLIAIKNKLLTYRTIPKLIPIVNLLAKNTKTDIDIKTALDLVKQESTLSDVKIETISLNTDNVLKETYSADGQYVLIPKDGATNWNSVHEYILKELEEENSTRTN